MELIFLFRCGSQTGTAYSKWGLTRAMYRRIKPAVQNSYLVVSSFTYFLYMSIPAETACDPNAKISVFIDNLKGITSILIGRIEVWFLFLDTNICLHFFALKQRKLLQTQLNRAFTSSWSSSKSSALRIGLNNRISSANRISVPSDNCTSLIPFIYSKKSRGPMQDWPLWDAWHHWQRGRSGTIDYDCLCSLAKIIGYLLLQVLIEIQMD